MLMSAGVESDAGTNGNPTLQVGGEQEAVTDPEPADGVDREQDCKHPPPVAITAGCDALQVKGILLRTTPLLVFGKELLPMMSVRTAVTVWAVPLEVTKVVWPVCWVPAGPSSRVMLWIGQVSKKSRAGDVPCEF